MAHINDSISGIGNREINVFNKAGIYYWRHVERFIKSDDYIKGIGDKTISRCGNILQDIKR